MTLVNVALRSPGRALPPAALRRLASAMDRDGAVAVDGLFPRPLLEKIRGVVLRRHESGELRRRALVRDIGGRYAAVLPFEGPFLERAFYDNPAVHQAMGALLGPSYCIGSLETVISLPGASGQHQHIDGPVRFDRLAGGRKAPYRGDLSDLPPYAVTVATPLCDVDEENGPTAVWRGSHREALRPRPPGEREVARRFPREEMSGPFGRSFLFDYRVFHCGTPNHSREARPLLIFVFVRPWFRDPNLAEVEPSVVIADRDLRRVPERRRGLFMLAPAARRRLWASKTT